MLLGAQEVRVGCGVRIEVPGTHWRVNAEVLELCEESQALRVKGADFEGWVLGVQVKAIIAPGDYVLDNAINVIGADVPIGE